MIIINHYILTISNKHLLLTISKSISENSGNDGYE